MRKLFMSTRANIFQQKGSPAERTTVITGIRELQVILCYLFAVSAYFAHVTRVDFKLTID